MCVKVPGMCHSVTPLGLEFRGESVCVEHRPRGAARAIGVGDGVRSANVPTEGYVRHERSIITSLYLYRISVTTSF